jgi:hypothetical protein
MNDMSKPLCEIPRWFEIEKGSIDASRDLRKVFDEDLSLGEIEVYPHDDCRAVRIQISQVPTKDSSEVYISLTLDLSAARSLGEILEGIAVTVQAERDKAMTAAIAAHLQELKTKV